MIREHPADAFVAGERFAFERAGRGQDTVELLQRDRRRLRLQNALDRGDGLRGVMHRAGTETPPRSRYEDTTLYALGKPLLPRGFRFDAEHPVPPPTPKKK